VLLPLPNRHVQGQTSAVPKAPSNVLRAVLFTDVVGSTELARELGDQRWGRLLEAQRRIVRDELRANRGREVDTAGDGFFAIFEGPADAVRCAFIAARRVQELGLDIRAGVHFGEIERSGDQAHGIVVHTGARVMGQAGGAEVLITQTVKDLVAGARFDVQERGVFELKGVPGRWTLFDVLKVDDQLRPEPVEDATVASERRERASAGPPARVRRRWLLPAAIIGVLAIAVASFVVLRPEPSYIPGAGTVARIDGHRFDRPIQVGSAPLALTEGEGRVWVMDRTSQIYWVDEQSGATGSRGTEGVPTGATTGAGAVWITAGFGTGAGPDATVSRLDTSTGQVSLAFTTPVDSQAIAFGADTIWVADPNTATVVRYDPVSRATRTIPLPRSDPPARPDSIAFGALGGAAIWVGDALSTNLYRVDTTGSNQIRTYTVGGPPTAIAMGTDAVWVTSERKDAVYAVDPASGSVRTSIDLGAQGCNAPTAIAISGQGVWVACSLSQRLMQIDPVTGTVIGTLGVAGTPTALTMAQNGSIWVAVQPR
jgi:class 3 adenylate cyclase/streptogramin lyase